MAGSGFCLVLKSMVPYPSFLFSASFLTRGLTCNFLQEDIHLFQQEEHF